MNLDTSTHLPSLHFNTFYFRITYPCMTEVLLCYGALPCVPDDRSLKRLWQNAPLSKQPLTDLAHLHHFCHPPMSLAHMLNTKMRPSPSCHWPQHHSTSSHPLSFSVWLTYSPMNIWEEGMDPFFHCDPVISNSSWPSHSLFPDHPDNKA